ncbi:oxidoreductase/dehydrogenase [Capsulimonas corticalis]|uniref:enoyl-[acyl-carrier-protein] reductase n=1 Tax=Capsulimonas corticalis TaxID=2219043 RepID=A0A402CTF7_9BACT|nr:zinc-binding dehydrogenase [Capsulimonas corticalis]BDI30755.1 oxidoreductase/dehydrogenase [Capsulimonas corticalis]
MMKAIVFDEIGSPQDVLKIRDVPIPEVKAGEALVKMGVASINPGDFLFIQDLYPEPRKPVFPQQIAGNHGAGVVERAGPGVDLAPGTLVAFSHERLWAEYAVVPANRLIALPADFPIEKASQFVNLITARDMLHQSEIQAGQWLAVTAGNSTVGVMLLQMAKQKQIHVVSIVRNKREDLDLQALGADEVIELSALPESLGDRIGRITDGAGIHAVIDCVGGSLMGDLIRGLAFGGRAIIYGGMSAETFPLHNFDILMRGVQVSSYVYRYFFDPTTPEDAPMLQELISIAQSPEFVVPVAGLHALEDFQVAITETAMRPERGKRFFAISSANG